MDYLYAVVLFAISASVTPGPNNIMVMSAGANFGIRRSLPLLMGICVGFTLMLLLVGLGFGQLFTLFPSLHFVIKCVGTLYLLYLAWLIARSADEVTGEASARPLGFLKGACSNGSMPRPGWSPPAPSPPSPARGPTSTSRT
ncbi:LysE family translocator [Aeromonas rivipollensis]